MSHRIFISCAYDEVPGGLCRPGRRRVGSGAQDPDSSAGVLNHREHVQPQDRELVAQREDLRVFILAAHRQQPQQRERVRRAEVGQSQQHGPSPCHSAPRHINAPHRALSRTTSAPPIQRLQPAWMRFSAGAALIIGVACRLRADCSFGYPEPAGCWWIRGCRET